MLNLDLRTILISYSLCNLICAIVLISLWKQNHLRFFGLNYCMLSFISNFAGVFLLGLRGSVPDFMSIWLGNILLMGGVLLIYVGIGHFLGQKIFHIGNIILLCVYALLQYLLIYVFPNLQYRMLLFSAVLTIYCVQMTWMLFSITDKKLKSIIKGVGIVSIAYWSIGIVRIGLDLAAPNRTDFFQATSIETIIYLLFQAIYIILTFYLFIMVNRRLILDLEEDIRTKVIIEKDLHTNQEKFQKAFMSNPNAMLLSKMTDGQIIEANDAFLKLSGYSRQETISNTTLNLGVWHDPKDRDMLLNLMRGNQKVTEFEFLGRNKAGKPLDLILSSESININDETYLISTLQDVSERKIDENVLSLRLSLWEYAEDHSILELMQKALDEIEKLTHSAIGFFHVVNETENRIISQVWSSKTKDSNCMIAKDNAHQSLDTAGVWADCIRERKPIIHNNYESLKSKNGIPVGHVHLVREMVIPIFNNSNIEAVLGVGNKDTDYEEKDVRLIKNLANLVWIIVLQKQADERIMQLNEKLENLAMTDELTKIDNRRAFFIKGNEEVLRTKRYKQPLSLIMMDIDRFKSINDSLGHDVGDFVLQCIANKIKEKIREVDIVGRVGGEEFAVLLPNTKLSDALLLAERLRKEIEENSCLKKEVQKEVTISLGVSEFQPEQKELDDLLKNADIALYLAKNNGRNRVESFLSDTKVE